MPHYVIDVPTTADEDAEVYIAIQLRELTALLEDATHRSLDPEALRATMVNSQRTIQAYQRALALRGKVSLDTTMTSELCAMTSTHIMLGNCS